MPMRHLALRHARLRPAAFVAALAVATTGLLGGTAAPAAAAEPTPTRLAVTPLSVSKNIGSGVTFAFTLSTSQKRLGGKTIDIYTRPKGNLTWTKRWTQTLNAYGNSKVAFTVQRSTYVKAKYAGNSLYAPAQSPAAYVAALSSLGSRVIT